ncbi:hypothetical protein C2869_14235 [Saccharobesus litoralis]|uniref:Nucleoid-associated protein n=1 Tax=Saccharobesus litoralis TaxID=2172099 RepID=A0A2S0VTJ5_9ALTE|nr:nucleoid-associated protein [Saccharobesus litoralis]AWB67527.1 hypothetical protein C2869_14235 [Saccharobesus litoralis]
MSLQQVIIHELFKEKVKKGEVKKPTTYTLGSLLDVTKEPVEALINSIIKVYGSKGNISAQGTFDHGEAQLFHTFVTRFMKGEITFEKFSKLTMDKIVKEVKGLNFATGGYFVFSSYKSTSPNTHDNDMLLIAIVKKKNGIELKDLEPHTIQTVDLSKLHSAARINLTNYAEWKKDKNEDFSEINSYLSFIKPPGSKTDKVGYFIDALGCTNITHDKKATEDVLDAVSDYFDNNEKISPFRSEAVEIVASKILEMSKTSEREYSLDKVDDLVTTLIPEEVKDELDIGFTEFANNDPYNVSSRFKCNSTAALKCLKIKISDKGGDWTLNAKRHLIGTSESSDIQFDEKNKRLIITKLSESLIKDLKSDLS